MSTWLSDKMQFRGWEIFRWEGRFEILAALPRFRQAASQFFWYQEQEEPNRVETVLGFSLKSDTHCGRQCSEDQTPQWRNAGFNPQAIRIWTFPTNSSNSQLLFCVWGPFRSHCYDNGGKKTVRVPLDSRSRKRLRLFVQTAKESCLFPCT